MSFRPLVQGALSLDKRRFNFWKEEGVVGRGWVFADAYWFGMGGCNGWPNHTRGQSVGSFPSRAAEKGRKGEKGGNHQTSTTSAPG